MNLDCVIKTPKIGRGTRVRNGESRQDFRRKKNVAFGIFPGRNGNINPVNRKPGPYAHHLRRKKSSRKTATVNKEDCKQRLRRSNREQSTTSWEEAETRENKTGLKSRSSRDTPIPLNPSLKNKGPRSRELRARVSTKVAKETGPKADIGARELRQTWRKRKKKENNSRTNICRPKRDSSGRHPERRVNRKVATGREGSRDSLYPTYRGKPKTR